MFSDELMNEDNKDFFSVFRNISNKFTASGRNFNEEAPLAFSTLRKLVPVGCSEKKRFSCLSFLNKFKFF